MGLIKKALKTATKVVGGNPLPSGADVLRAANRINPVRGINRVTAAINKATKDAQRRK